MRRTVAVPYELEHPVRINVELRSSKQIFRLTLKSEGLVEGQGLAPQVPGKYVAELAAPQIRRRVNSNVWTS
jgi:hypothetical protein